MKLTKQILSIILCITLMIGLIPMTAQAAEPVKLSKKSVTLKITKTNSKTTYGKSTIKVKPSKGIKVKKVTYKSKNKKIATVSKKGVVTAKKNGNTSITATVKYQKKVKNKWKTYTKKLTYKVKVKVVDNRTKSTKTTEKSTKVVTTEVITTEKPTTEIVTTEVATTEKPTTEVVTTEIATTEKPTTEVVTTEIATTEKPTTEVVTTEIATTEKPTTEVDITETTENTSGAERIEFDYMYFDERYNRYCGLIHVQKPTTTQSGIYQIYDIWATPETYTNDNIEKSGIREIPILDSIELIDGIEYGKVITQEPDCDDAGTVDVYDLRSGLPAGIQSIDAIGHTSDNILHARINFDNETGSMHNKCVRCGDSLNAVTVDFAENSYTYSDWITEPSETEEGIMGVYQGVDIYGMTEEEKATKYKSFDVIFDDGTTDTFYGNWINELREVVDDKENAWRFEVCARSTAVKIGELTYPKYEVVEINLGDTDGDGIDETTKVYGYYDRDIANEMYDLLNQYRVENGVPELTIFDKAQAMSDIRSAEFFYTHLYNLSKDSNDEGYYPHTRPTYLPYHTISTQECTLLLENEQTTTLISKYQEGGLVQAIDLTADYALQRFKDSEGHNQNLLAPNVYGVGISVFIGYPQDENGNFKPYKVAITMQDFSYQSE